MPNLVTVTTLLHCTVHTTTIILHGAPADITHCQSDVITPVCVQSVRRGAIQKRKNLVIKRKTKAFNSAKYYIIKTQAVGS